jgi:AcrR family transcriptional regulator
MGSQEALSASASGEPSPTRRKLSPGPGMAAKDVTAHQLARIYNATVDLVSQRGYQALKVRDVVSGAEVSTRAFYELFSSKEDCFLQTYDRISRRAARRLIAAQAGEPDWRQRPRLIFEEFVRELESNPDGARVALIEAYAADQACREQAWKAERMFEAMLAEALARTPGGVAVPPLIVEGIIGGTASVARGHLRTGKVRELRDAGGDLIEWALSYPGEAMVGLLDLDRRSVWRDTALEPNGYSGIGDEASKGDRSLILSATAKLAAERGYDGLTAARIRSAASVSRRKFEAHFDGVDDCYLAALERSAAEAFAQAARAQAAASTWPGGVYRAIVALCDRVAGDPFLARVCLTDDFPPGASAARSRQRLVAATIELLMGAAPRSSRPVGTAAEALVGAVWSVFQRHVVRDLSLRRQVAASLSYLALAPAVGASKAAAAIEREQGP